MTCKIKDLGVIFRLNLRNEKAKPPVRGRPTLMILFLPHKKTGPQEAAGAGRTGPLPVPQPSAAVAARESVAGDRRPSAAAAASAVSARLAVEQQQQRLPVTGY